MKRVLIPVWVLSLGAAMLPLSAQEGTSAAVAAPPAASAQAPPATAGDPDQADTPPLSASEPKSVPSAGDPLYAPLALAPQTLDEKFMDYLIVTVGPRALAGHAFSAAIRMAHPPSAYPRDWKDGAGAFERNYGSSLAKSAASRTGRFVVAALLHEDFRYRPSTSRNFFARSFHAIGFTFVDRSDSGKDRIALANFAGAVSGALVGEALEPPGYNDRRHARTEVITMLGSMAGQNLLREFAPDIMRASRKTHLPFPRIPLPAWWDGRRR